MQCAVCIIFCILCVCVYRGVKVRKGWEVTLSLRDCQNEIETVRVCRVGSRYVCEFVCHGVKFRFNNSEK